MRKMTWCDCEGRRVESHECDGCEPWDDCWSDDDYEDPPLYPVGKLAGMTVADLEKERDRQADIQGALGDAEHIDDVAVERAEARGRLVDNEIKRRKDDAALRTILGDALAKFAKGHPEA